MTTEQRAKSGVGSGDQVQFDTSGLDHDRFAGEDLSLFRVEIDVVRDYADRGRSLLELPQDVAAIGEMIDSVTIPEIETCLKGTDEDNPLLLVILLASQRCHADIVRHWSIDPSRVTKFTLTPSRTIASDETPTEITGTKQ